MQWTVRLEAETGASEVNTTELATFSRPGVLSTLAEIGLMLAETRMLLAKLQASMLCGQVAAYAAHHRTCAVCGVLQPLKDRRTRRLQTLFGTVEVEAPQFKVCRCRQPAPLAEVTVSPVCALLTAQRTPELERVQAELGAHTSFRDGAHSGSFDQAQVDVARLRDLLWNGYHKKACKALGRITNWGNDAVAPNEPAAEAKVRRLAARCTELRSYIENNEGALIDYGQRH